MSAATYNFEIEQGTSLNKSVVWKDSNGVVINLTGYTARMQIRETIDSDLVLLELSTSNGKISLTPGEGKITLEFDPADTSGEWWTRGRYDLELTSASGFVTRVLKGKVTLSKEVTRD